MAKIRTLQLYRGTTAQNDAYTGSAGELTMDTTTNELRVHDGSTAGGHVVGSGGGSSYHPDLFDVKWADHICNDVQWLRADTYSWQSGAVYQAAYAHLEDDIDGKTLQSETIAGTTIQFYLADDGHKICPASEESNVTAIYNATGIAWYYIIDTANTRFKLPRTQFAFTGIRSGVGAFVEAGVPNITGNFHSAFRNSETSGAFQLTAETNGFDGKTNNTGSNITFDASRSSSIYGNSDTVQPKATEMYLYFYVGNFTQTALENTAGLNAELFNNKVDKGHQVIAFQAPTAENNYTWYRKYADGWVEQGGFRDNITDTSITITLPVEMANVKYAPEIKRITTGSSSSQPNVNFMAANTITTTSFRIPDQWGGSGVTVAWAWEAKGMAA